MSVKASVKNGSIPNEEPSAWREAARRSRSFDGGKLMSREVAQFRTLLCLAVRVLCAALLSRLLNSSSKVN